MRIAKLPRQLDRSRGGEGGDVGFKVGGPPEVGVHPGRLVSEPLPSRQELRRCQACLEPLEHLRAVP